MWSVPGQARCPRCRTRLDVAVVEVGQEKAVCFLVPLQEPYVNCRVCPSSSGTQFVGLFLIIKIDSVRVAQLEGAHVKKNRCALIYDRLSVRRCIWGYWTSARSNTFCGGMSECTSAYLFLARLLLRETHGRRRIVDIGFMQTDESQA
jgi:hypothetical protein